MPSAPICSGAAAAYEAAIAKTENAAELAFLRSRVRELTAR